MFTEKDKLSTDLSTIIPQKTLIIVVLVHFGDVAATNRLVADLLAGKRLPDQLIVVDHDPLPYECRSSQATCVRPHKNNGYIAGLRFGVRAAKAPDESILVLLNNDSMITDNFLIDIAAWWRKHGGASVLAGPGIASLSRLTGRARIGTGQSYDMLFSLPYIDGACVVVQRSFFDTISSVEHLFMYWEDVALSMRAQSSGGRIQKIPNLGFEHHNAAEPASGKKLYYLVRNGAYILERLSFPWNMYWIIKNKVRLLWHSVLPGARHIDNTRALKDAQRLL